MNNPGTDDTGREYDMKAELNAAAEAAWKQWATTHPCLDERIYRIMQLAFKSGYAQAISDEAMSTMWGSFLAKQKEATE